MGSSFEELTSDFEAVSKAESEKLSQVIEKVAYTDGIHAGRESVFQHGFDIGYEEGFKNGYLIGQYKGRFVAENPNDLITDDLLMKTGRGQCEICRDNSIINKSIKEITDQQENRMVKVADELKNKFGSIN